MPPPAYLRQSVSTAARDALKEAASNKTVAKSSIAI